MIMATKLSKSAVKRATEISKNSNNNAVIVEIEIGNKLRQMALSEHDYNNRVVKNIEAIAVVDPSGAIS